MAGKERLTVEVAAERHGRRRAVVACARRGQQAQQEWVGASERRATAGCGRTYMAEAEEEMVRLESWAAEKLHFEVHMLQ